MITSFTLTSLSCNFTIPSYSIQTTLKPILKKIWTKHAVMEYKEELVNIFDTKWYKKISSTATPGETLKINRENFGLSQTE